MFYQKSKSINPLEHFQKATVTIRAVSFMMSAMLIFFVFTTPSFAAGLEAAKEKNIAYAQDSAKRQSKNINKAVEVLEAIKDSRRSSQEKKELAKALKDLQKEIRKEEQYAQGEFEKMHEHIKSKNLPQVFAERLEKMEEKYNERKEKLNQLIDNTATRYSGVFRASTLNIDDVNLSEFKSNKEQEFDPNNLPFNIRPTKKITPKTTKDEFISQGLINQPLPQYAALGDFDYSTLASASNSEYLAPSDEVQITQAIKDKAAELNYNPVHIYDFVRNEIEFIPTWGAVQGDELTLGAKRGNSIDIASLLISLLRASEIPARYVHGTVEITTAQMKNWYGGWEDVNSALTFANSNGLPVVSMVSGGKVEAVRMEHVWVEAAIDYFPSRGVKNLKADAWVPLDASYKQYEFKKGIDALSASGADINGTLQSFIDGADINESAGYVSGMDSTIIDNMLQQAQSNLEANITAQLDDSNKTLFDIIGGKRIIKESHLTLPSNIKPKVVVEGARYAKIPSSLQQKVTYNLEHLTLGYSLGGVVDGGHSITLPYSRVNNQKVTLSYAPATQADSDALESLLLEDQATGSFKSPNVLPSYVQVKPQIKLNGQIILEGNVMSLGESINVNQAVHFVNSNSEGFKKHKSHAGDYLALGSVSQSVSPRIISKLRNKINATRDIFSNGDFEEIGSISREDMLGDMNYAMMLGYYAQLLNRTQMLQNVFNVNEVMTGYGTFGLEMDPNSRFGLSTGIKLRGIGLDIPLSKVIVADNNNYMNFKNYRVQAGTIASILEHQTPEQMYNTSTNATQAISTVKAFALANAEGQKIYTLNKENIDLTLPNIQASPSVRSDIQKAINAGQKVSVHEKPVSVAGWAGTGYMVISPENYNTAFLIDGGSNGGFQMVADLQNFLWIAVAASLGGVDGYTSKAAGKKFMFSTKLNKMAKMAGISKFLGIVGLIFQSTLIMSDDTLSYGQKIAQLALNAAVFMATYYATGILIFFIPVFAAVLGVIIAGILATIGIYLASLYLSRAALFDKRRYLVA